MKCPWCGADSPVGAITCYNCGLTWSAENGPKPSPNEHRWQNQPRPQPPQSQYQTPPSKLYQKKNPEYAMIVAAVVVAILILVPIAFLASSTNHQADRIVGPLDGTWTTQGTAFFYIRSSWSSDRLTDIGYEERRVSMVITSTSEAEKVDVEMSYSVENINVSYYSAYVSDQSPMHYDGRWNGTSLWLSLNGDVKGTFTFTDTVITGTWRDYEQESYFSQEIHTILNGFNLKKQSNYA